MEPQSPCPGLPGRRRRCSHLIWSSLHRAGTNRQVQMQHYIPTNSSHKTLYAVAWGLQAHAERRMCLQQSDTDIPRAENASTHKNCETEGLCSVNRVFVPGQRALATQNLQFTVEQLMMDVNQSMHASIIIFLCFIVSVKHRRFPIRWLRSPYDCMPSQLVVCNPIKGNSHLGSHSKR